MKSSEIREKFLKFFEARGHKIVPSSSLVPEGDSSVLFTTAGMQQFKPYYTKEKDAMADFGTLNTVSIQKCIRTSDIDEVGDETHLTFFEMLGNFSFGGYWKKEAIEYAHEFITKELGLKIDYVSVFNDSESGIPADEESRQIWLSIDPGLKVVDHGRSDNFWGPTGEEGPCGPTTEIYINGVEIWNIVFNEYYKTKSGEYTPLEVKGIDTGMGLERLAIQVQGKKNIFETDLFAGEKTREERIIADHTRAVGALIADGVVPSNKDQGYILRRLIRRGLMHAHAKKIPFDVASPVFSEEKKKFEETLESGLKQFEKGVDPFILFTTYGFPFELTEEVAREKGLSIDRAKFEEAFKKHQETSRAGAEQKFKGGLAGHSEMEVKYHTATHLLHQALHDVLGEEVGQRGSNITPERLRFDFSFPRKMIDEEKKQVEEIVNQKIAQALPVNKVLMSKTDAEKTGARHFFGEKYPDEVSIYYIGDSLESAYSKEFCGGPHVENIGTLGRFKIAKEEAISAGVRRVKAVLE